MMKAYVVAAETVKNEAMFAEYRKAVPATLEAFGGKFIVRGGNLKLLEGQWPHAISSSSNFRRGRRPKDGTDRRSTRRSLGFDKTARSATSSSLKAGWTSFSRNRPVVVGRAGTTDQKRDPAFCGELCCNASARTGLRKRGFGLW
jgi:hypothetical protein